MSKRTTFLTLAQIGALTGALAAAGCSSPASEQGDSGPSDASPSAEARETSYTVVSSADVKWEHLNPARGAKSPSAGTLWGDRQGSVATGFLLRPRDGFRSPPHIHNVTYRGIVIRGLLHNDDPTAEEMWLPAGSFWTQPKGASHITAAKGPDTLAYIEIEEGPYRVMPTKEAFETPEVPVNVDASNLVWVDLPGGAALAKRPQVAYLWGDPQGDALSGVLLKLPAGFKGTLQSSSSSLGAVLVKGRLDHRTPGQAAPLSLEVGSYFSSEGSAGHQLTCPAGAESVLYLRTAGQLKVLGTPKG